ncbi:hypothetical protein B296_00025327, partial [Ensete ventricosum]
MIDSTVPFDAAMVRTVLPLGASSLKRSAAPAQEIEKGNTALKEGIALRTNALVPGLKKVSSRLLPLCKTDKASVLGDTVEYLKLLQEKVKSLVIQAERRLRRATTASSAFAAVERRQLNRGRRTTANGTGPLEGAASNGGKPSFVICRFSRQTSNSLSFSRSLAVGGNGGPVHLSGEASANGSHPNPKARPSSGPPLPSTLHHLRLFSPTITLALIVIVQAEKEIQIAKSHLLSEKIEDVRRAERRCLLLERRNVEIAHRILTNRTQIDAVDARYQAAAREYRHALIFTPCLLIDACTNCTAIEELEEREKERDGFYAANRAEMEEFKERTRRFVSDTQEEVRKLRDWVSE